ncbi:MAG: flagellar basal body P-ring protein FlgI [Gammaproteobacteria bacterium]|nr:MAG: flagellar basal body P-ring protein FlgI [Gammaproteobacteria bacterium]
MMRKIKMPIIKSLILLLVLSPLFAHATAGDSVRLKDLARIDGIRDNSLSGYGLVIGLAGTGDSSRNGATLQSVANMLKAFGVVVPSADLYSRNVAAVVLTANLPPFAESGQKLDVNVSSLGDSRSLVGGTLLLAPLKGPDQKVYALAQGPISIGGFKYDMYGNMVQKNHPTVGIVPGGAIVERVVDSQVVKKDGTIDLVLYHPDFTTAGRVADSINRGIVSGSAKAVHAGKIRVTLDETSQNNIVDFIRDLESLKIVPDQKAKVVVNERTGTVVSGGDVKISSTSVTQGELKISIKTDFEVSQPTLVAKTGEGVRSVITPDTQIEVTEGNNGSVNLPAGTTVADLVAALNKIKTSTRDIIVILQAIKRSGGLHAELVIQ